MRFSQCTYQATSTDQSACLDRLTCSRDPTRPSPLAPSLLPAALAPMTAPSTPYLHAISIRSDIHGASVCGRDGMTCRATGARAHSPIEVGRVTHVECILEGLGEHLTREGVVLPDNGDKGAEGW